MGGDRAVRRRGGISETASYWLDVTATLVNSAPGKARHTAAAAGQYRFRASVTDVNGNATVADVTVEVVPNLAGPKVSFSVPAEGATITEPAQMIGTIDDEQDDLVTHWNITAMWTENPGELMPIAQGSGERFNAALGLLDTSMLPNGTYILTLSACDEYNAWSHVTREVQVRGQLKLGYFSFSVSDLVIDTPGVPITVSRTYDTLTAAKQLDFGYGWKWDLGNPKLDIRYADTTPTPFYGNYVPFREGTRVVITLPDGTEQGFTFLPQPDIDNPFGFGYENLYEPYFHPDPQTTTFLELAEKVTLLKQGGVYLVMTQSGAISDFAFNPAVPYTQNDLVLYTKTGVRYGLDPAGSGRTWIEDQKGNQVVYQPGLTETLISHSNKYVAGGPTRTVTVKHPAELITEIVDPAGNSIFYGYENGELRSVTNRLGKTTTYEYASTADPWYDPARHEHYLKTVIDPLGRRLAAAEYSGADGRLGKTTDAAGHETIYSYGAGLKSETITAEGLTPTSVVADARGNVIREEGPDGLILRKYDSWDRLIEETRVVGEIDSADGEKNDLTTQYAFDAYGLPTSQTDARGNTSTVQYDTDGNPITIAQAVGGATTNTFDERGNLLTSTSGGVTTSFEYDAWGNVTKVTRDNGEVLVDNSYNALGLLERSVDANGRETRFTYDALGNVVDSWYVVEETVEGQPRDVTFKTHSVYDAEGRLTGTYEIVRHGAEAEKYLSSMHTEYNDAGQVYRTMRRTYEADGSTVESELISESRYDARGLVVESRSQGLATGSATPVWFVQQTVYDAQGRAVYSTDRFAEGTPVAEIGGTHAVYNADGRVESTSRLLGLSIDVAATLVGVDDANQVYASSLVSEGTALWTTSTTYEDNRVSETVDRFGRRVQYTYNQFGETVEVRREVGDDVWLLSQTVYDGLGRAAYSTDEYLEGSTAPVYGTRTLFDAQGRVIETRRLQGMVVELSASGTRLVKEGTVLYRTKTAYDAEGRVVKSTAADGQVTNFEYDCLGRQTAVIGQAVPAKSVGLIVAGDPLVRHRTETVYDAAGRVYQEIGNIRQFADGTLDRSAQQVTTYDFDAAGNVVKTTQTAAGSTLEVVTRSEYDFAGRKTADVDALGNRTEYVLDSQGRLFQVVLPAVDDPYDLVDDEPVWKNPVYEYRYDAQGNQTHVVDPYGHTTEFTFDSHGRQESRTLPLGVETTEPGDFTETFEHDALGREVLHVSFEGVVTERVFDDAAAGGGRLTEQRFFESVAAYDDGEGTAGEVWLYTHDAFGRQVRVERQTLDELGAVVASAVTDYRFDAQGRLTCQTSPEGEIRYEYDSLGRKTRTYTGSPTQVTNDWRYSYDALGRLAEVTVAKRNGAATDANPYVAGNQPEATRYHYDLVGNLDWEWHSNWIVTDYGYDGLNRLVQVLHRVGWFEDVPLGAEPFAQYDYELLANGARASATETFVAKYDVNSWDQVNTIQWTYDALGRLTDEVFATNIDELAGWQTVNGSLPEGSRPLEDYADAYVYDLAGNRVRKTTDYVRAAAVDEAIEYLYDGNDRLLLEELDLGADESVDKTTRYEYGPNANAASDYGGDWTAQTKKSVFNALDTPLSATGFSYDLQGRLETSVMEAYQSDGSAVARRDVTSFDYDHTGIRVWSGNKIELWDPSRGENGELVEVRDFETEYLVDHENFTGYEQVLTERTVNVEGGWTVRTVVYTVGHDVIGQWSQGTIAPPSLGESSWVEIPSGSHLLLYDGHGSTRVLARAGGWNYDYEVPWLQQYSYDAYGIALGFDPELAATNVLYSGEVMQVEIGMQYLRARYYEMATGRWNRLDPYAGNMSDPVSLHKYLYAFGDPIQHDDPSGLMPNLPGLLSGMTIRAQMIAGAVGGAYLQALRNVTVGRPWHENVLTSGLKGAFLFPLMLKYPLFGLAGAFSLFWDSWEVALDVYHSPSSTPGQRVGATLYITFSLLALAGAGENYGAWTGGRLLPPVPDEAYYLGVIRRSSMPERPTADQHGQPVTIWGQEHSTSQTAGHDATILRTTEEWAWSGKYEHVLMQRTVRTAIGREIPRGDIPDVVGVSRAAGDARPVVDLGEVRSNSQTYDGQMAKLRAILADLPPEMRGEAFVFEPRE